MYNKEIIENKNKENTYLKIKVNNDIWIINRITSLLRRRKYSIDNFTVYFDNKNNAYLIIQIQANKDDKIQLINQLLKLYDIINITEINILEKIFYVYSDNKEILNALSFKYIKLNKTDINYIWLYLIDLGNEKKFRAELKEKSLYYEWQM